MLGAVAGVDLDRAVVAPEGHGDNDGAFGKVQALGDERRNVGVRERLLELRARHEEERRVPFEGPLRGRCLHVGQGRRSLGSGFAKGEGEGPYRMGPVDVLVPTEFEVQARLILDEIRTGAARVGDDEDPTAEPD